MCVTKQNKGKSNSFSIYLLYTWIKNNLSWGKGRNRRSQNEKKKKSDWNKKKKCQWCVCMHSLAGADEINQHNRKHRKYVQIENSNFKVIFIIIEKRFFVCTSSDRLIRRQQHSILINPGIKSSRKNRSRQINCNYLRNVQQPTTSTNQSINIKKRQTENRRARATAKTED